MQPRRILIDTDPGADDAVALALALRSPELEVAGITAVNGNVSVHKAAANIQRLLNVLKSDPKAAQLPPVAKGADRPLHRPRIGAEHVHGQDGVGGASRLRGTDGALLYPAHPAAAPLDQRSAVDMILDEAREGTSLAALGPLTNIALALRKDPAAVRRYDRIAAMCGAFRTGGNATPQAEYNAFADPHAVQEALNARLPIVFIPLDATNPAVLPAQTLQNARGPTARFLQSAARRMLAFSKQAERIDGMRVHDAVAVAYLIAPELFQVEETRARIETADGPALGRTDADPNAAPNAQIAFQAQTQPILDLLNDRVFGFSD